MSNNIVDDVNDRVIVKILESHAHEAGLLTTPLSYSEIQEHHGQHFRWFDYGQTKMHRIVIAGQLLHAGIAFDLEYEGFRGRPSGSMHLRFMDDGAPFAVDIIESLKKANLEHLMSLVEERVVTFHQLGMFDQWLNLQQPPWSEQVMRGKQFKLMQALEPDYFWFIDVGGAHKRHRATTDTSGQQGPVANIP